MLFGMDDHNLISTNTPVSYLFSRTRIQYNNKNNNNNNQ